MEIYDRIKETTTVTGTGPATVLGAASKHRTWGSKVRVGKPVPYMIVHQSADEWESGMGRYSAGVLTRTSVKASSNSDALVNFSAGTKDIFVTDNAHALTAGLVDPRSMRYFLVALPSQSNGAGRGPIDTSIDLAHPRVHQFGCTPADARYRTIFGTVDPLHCPAAETGNAGKMSTAGAFVKALADILPSNIKILLVPTAVGGTFLVNGAAQWAPSLTPGAGGTLFENLVTEFNLAMTAARAIYPDSVAGVFLQQLGESDSGSGILQAQFAAGQRNLIDYLRVRCTDATESVHMIIGMTPELVAQGGGYANVNAAQIQVAAEKNRCLFVAAPAGFAMDSNLHLTAAGSRKAGALAAQLYPDALEYSSVDTTAPLAAFAGVAHATPTFLDITFTEAMNQTITPSHTTLTIDGHTASALAWLNSTTWRVTMTAGFVYGEAARTVAYAQPGSNQARDLAGNLLASFTGLAITNSVMAAPGAPTIGTATAGNASASIAFTAPGSNGGSAITGYTLTSSPGGITGTGATSPVVVAGLTNNTAYTFTATATNAIGTGPASAASNSVTPTNSNTVPGAPTIGTATRGNAQASITFTAPASNGGDPITSYTLTSSPGAITGSGSVSPVVVTGLTNGVSYTFTATATNGVGTGAASAASNAVTPATVPGAPTIGTLTGGDVSASITFTAPASNGGETITGYTASSYKVSDDTLITTNSGATSPIAITGLTNGVAMYAKVAATNAVGAGSQSAASNSVTPAAADLRARAGFTTLTEGGSSGAWTYAGAGETGFNATGAVMNQGRAASSANASFTYVRQAHTSVSAHKFCVCVISGTEPLALAGRVFTLLHDSAGVYTGYAGSGAVTFTGADTPQTAAVGDWVRVRFTSTTSIIFEVSKNSGSTWLHLHTLNGVSTGALNFQLQLLGNSSGIYGGFVGANLSAN